MQFLKRHKILAKNQLLVHHHLYLLLEQQQRLLSRYIASFHDDGVDLKIFLNEEIGRLSSAIKQSLNDEEIKEDETLAENANQVLTVLGDFSKQEISAPMIEQVLKIQSLAYQIISKSIAPSSWCIRVCISPNKLLP